MAGPSRSGPGTRRRRARSRRSRVAASGAGEPPGASTPCGGACDRRRGRFRRRLDRAEHPPTGATARRWPSRGRSRTGARSRWGRGHAAHAAAAALTGHLSVPVAGSRGWGSPAGVSPRTRTRSSARLGTRRSRRSRRWRSTSRPRRCGCCERCARQWRRPGAPRRSTSVGLVPTISRMMMTPIADPPLGAARTRRPSAGSLGGGRRAGAVRARTPPGGHRLRSSRAGRGGLEARGAISPGLSRAARTARAAWPHAAVADRRRGNSRGRSGCAPQRRFATARHPGQRCRVVEEAFSAKTRPAPRP